MKIKWVGHACFLITSDSGLRIITDPYENQLSLRWEILDEEADIVTVSHEHFDHNNVAAIRGNPEVIRESTVAQGITFKCIETQHGAQMGENRLFGFQVDGIAICHCGDLGHVVSDGQANSIGDVDVLIVPIGGTYTLDAESATSLYEKLHPRIVLPVHYSSDKMVSDIIAPIDGFLKGKKNIIRLDTSEIELTKEDLPSDTQIMLMKSQN